MVDTLGCSKVLSTAELSDMSWAASTALKMAALTVRRSASQKAVRWVDLTAWLAVAAKAAHSAAYWALLMAAH